MANGGDLMHSSFSAQLPSPGTSPLLPEHEREQLGRQKDRATVPAPRALAQEPSHAKNLRVFQYLLSHTFAVVLLWVPHAKSPYQNSTHRAPSAAHGWTGKSPCIQNPAFRLLHPTQPNNKPLNWSPGDLHTLCIDTNKLRR